MNMNSELGKEISLLSTDSYPNLLEDISAWVKRPKHEADSLLLHTIPRLILRYIFTPLTSSRDGASVNTKKILLSNERVIASQGNFLPVVGWRKRGLGAVVEFFSILFIVD
jgi:hypothetical protein